MNSTCEQTNFLTTASTSRMLMTACIVLLSFSLRSGTIEFDNQPYGSIGQPALDKSNLAIDADANGVGDGGVMFEVNYDLVDLTGDLITRDVTASGNIVGDDFNADGSLAINGDNANWRASDTVSLKTQVSSDTRFISSWDPVSASGVRFQWSSGLTDEMKGQVGSSEILGWVRGHSVNEGDGFDTDGTVDPSELRTRTHPYGPVVHSGPQYEGAPNALASNDEGFIEFIENYKARDPMVYVGANDGMLHAHLVSTGEEVFAYIPNIVLDRLADMTSQTYKQQYYVDGTPTIGTAYGDFDTCSTTPCWRTILVSGLNSGGEAIFAIDVTDPSDEVDTESAAAGLALWEFTWENTDSVESSLGYTFSRPIIAKLGDGTWVAVFGNGYNSVSTNYRASLIIVDLATGVEIQKLPVGPSYPGSPADVNGLSSVTPWDNDFDGIIDAAYAGDLEGNLWKFDFSSADSSGGVTIAYGGNPLVKVEDSVTADPDKTLSITTAPLLTVNPEDLTTAIIYFGTGKMLEHTDVNSSRHDAIYAIFETVAVQADSNGLGTNPNLVTHTVAHNDDFLRAIASTSTPSDPFGCKLQLPAGERLVNEMALTDDRLTFTTVDPLQLNNQNWLTAVDFMNCGALAEPFFDANDDGAINESDKISVGSLFGVVPIGGGLGQGTVSAPTVASVAGGMTTIFITRGEEGVQEFDPPEVIESSEVFTDAGLAGGHFDEDTWFDGRGIWMIDKNYSNQHYEHLNRDPSCTDIHGWEHCVRNHEHEYDDGHNIDGVNMLEWDGDPDWIVSGDVLDATGILGKMESIRRLGEFGDLALDQGAGPPARCGTNKVPCDETPYYEYPGYDSGTPITLQVANPYSVDTPQWALDRLEGDVGNGSLAPDATIYYQCASDVFDGTPHAVPPTDSTNWPFFESSEELSPYYLTRYDNPSDLDDTPEPPADMRYFAGSAQDFNALSVADRTCPIGNITVMAIRHNDIAALRANEPPCLRDWDPNDADLTDGPLLPPDEYFNAVDISIVGTGTVDGVDNVEVSYVLENVTEWLKDGSGIDYTDPSGESWNTPEEFLLAHEQIYDTSETYYYPVFATDPVTGMTFSNRVDPFTLKWRQNTAYLDASITVQAIKDWTVGEVYTNPYGTDADGARLPYSTAPDGARYGVTGPTTGKVIWENSNYEHLGASLDLSQTGIVIQCGVINEDLRDKKDPSIVNGGTDTTDTTGGGSTEDPADPDLPPGEVPPVILETIDGTAYGDSGIVQFAPNSTQGTGEEEQTGTSIPDGRVNWREIGRE